MFNNDCFTRIKNEFDNNINSHSYMLYTNDFFRCKRDFDILIKYLFKNDNVNSFQNDYIVISRSDKKNILKDDMINLKNFFQKTSYVNRYRVYLVEEAHKLNASSANMILKFLEEPLDGVIAFFITTNLDSVISTIKSRTQIINVFYEKEENIMSYDFKILDEFFSLNKYVAQFSAKEYFKKYDRVQLIDLFTNYLEFCYSDISNLENISKIKMLNKVINMLNNNVNVDYVFDYIFLGGDKL